MLECAYYIKLQFVYIMARGLKNARVYYMYPVRCGTLMRVFYAGMRCMRVKYTGNIFHCSI